MASEQAREFRQNGIAAAKAGRKEEARQLLQESLRLEPNNESAWLWLASVARDPQEQLTYLTKLLELNPNNETGRRALAALQAREQQPPAQPSIPKIRPIGGMAPPPEQDVAPQVAPPRTPVQQGGGMRSTQEIMAQPPGIPVPNAEHLAAVQKQAEKTVQDYLTRTSADTGIQWIHKTRRRAGERDAFFMRIYLSSGAFIVIALILVGLGVFVASNPTAQSIVFGPTPTLTFTPTFTPTPTPGLTPTPSITPELTVTSSPTVPAIIPTDDPFTSQRATPIYPPFGEALVQEAIQFANEGDFGAALPLFAEARGLTENRFDPRPYYFESWGLIAAEEYDRALQIMEDAEARLGEVALNEANEFRPIIDAGFANVYAARARSAAAAGEDAQMRSNLNPLLQRADDALASDPDNPQTQLALATYHRLSGNIDQALQVLNDALEREDLLTNVELILERGDIYFEQEEYDLAAYEAFLALFINPETEAAHLLRVNLALEQDQPGLAVIYAQNYLFYFPGSTQGWKLLGDARVREGNTDLALEAYTRALAAEDVTAATVDALLARAALYTTQRRDDLAREDLTQALNITESDEIQALRMQAAYRAGNYATALDDADELSESDVIAQAALDFIRARALIDQADDDDTETFQEALDLLSGVSGLEADDQAIRDEYTARAQFALNNLTNALNSINNALAVNETGTRHYVKGLILEAQGSNAAAAREYEWVVSWGEIFPFDFRTDAEQRLENLTGS